MEKELKLNLELWECVNRSKHALSRIQGTIEYVIQGRERGKESKVYTAERPVVVKEKD